MKKEEWSKILDVNLNGYLRCAQAVFPQMKKQKKGSIINIASVAGLSSFANSAAYNASKAAINMLTKTIAQDWAKYGIRANAICPGVFITPMTQGLLKDKGFQTMIKMGTTLQRAGKPEELAGLAVYLASDASSYMTGSIIPIDGGWTCHL
jgi:NAD(P)-dependent dehydrogenase (short-subunit alcohol dehydrogenase family)